MALEGSSRRGVPYGIFVVAVRWIGTRSESGVLDREIGQLGSLSILLSTLRSNCTVSDRLNGQYGLGSATPKSFLDS